jgi:hypothetical protein
VEPEEIEEPEEIGKKLTEVKKLKTDVDRIHNEIREKA